jgi:hypothetical protein
MAPSKKTGTVATTAALTAEDLLSFNESSRKMLEIPELPKDGRPGVVWLQPLTAGQVMDFAARQADNMTEAEKSQAMLEMIARAVVDQNGQQLFSEEQVGRLRDMSMAVFSRLTAAVNELTGVGKRVEAGKDSSATASGDSPSA